MYEDFDETIEKFRNKELNIDDWNFCKNLFNNRITAYIIGCGAEQCLAKKTFTSIEELESLYHSLGVKRIIWI